MGRFVRSAQALGGRFKEIQVQPAARRLMFSLSAGNEENPDLTIGETKPGALSNGALIDRRGLRARPDAPVLVNYRRSTEYWSLAGSKERYSDVAIFPA